MKKIQAFVVLSLLAGLIAGCGSKDTNITVANNGQPTTIHVGGKVVVELDANPSTGFTWDVAELDTHILNQVGQAEFKSAGSTPMPGQGGTQTLRFQALAPGTTTLKLIYHRAFDQSTPPAQTFSVQVTVAP